MAFAASADKYYLDDTFENEEEDKVRLYGSTRESNPLQAKKLSSVKDDPPTENINLHDEEHIDQSNNASVEGNETDRFFPESRYGLQGSFPSSGSFADGASISTKTWPEDESWLKHPKVRENWRVVLASFILVLVGIALLITGVTVQSVTGEILHSFVFFIIGVICLIPGAYHLIYIYCAVRGRPGFSFYNLPVLK